MMGRQITVRGRVQGVGFRPFVWRLATDAGLRGHVLNDGSGVKIAVWGTTAALDAFQQTLTRSPPPLAKIKEVAAKPLNIPAPQAGFYIAESDSGDIRTEITPDGATCADCLAEILDPGDRRYRYAFTNCTHCGPRLSIVTGIPYDRAQTSMHAFNMCAACAHEYQDPSNRRFHAQPNACPVCGPKAWLRDAQGTITCADPLTETAKRIRQGQIIAIKGIGGYHLACDATNAPAVQRLRDRKRRVAKPFALMASDLSQISRYCQLSDAESDLLTSPVAPIVLLKVRPDAPLPGIAPGLDRIGVMLPHSPLHHLLLKDVDGPLIMTSGNRSENPQVTDNDTARRALAGIADAWLMHDRDIVNRLDDSLMQLDDRGPIVLRRGRGLAPASIPLPDGFADASPTLAMGAELKSTFCLLRNGQAIPSQHIGDLTSAQTYADFRDKIGLFQDLYDIAPEVIAVDMHPDYLSTQWGQQLATETGARVVKVQHHHAHMASCLAEHEVDLSDARSVGIILDGTGFGTNGTIWGGEILLGDYCEFVRVAHFQPVALPGGERAVCEPWRNLVAHLMAAFGDDWEERIAGTPLSEKLAQKPSSLISQMIRQELNAPLASSAGRLFDAVAAALGIVFDQQLYEGQAAMELEAKIGDPAVCEGYPAAISDEGVITWAPLWSALLADIQAGVVHATIAARFHNGLTDMLADIAARTASDAQTKRIVLSGGVTQNRFLQQYLAAKLHARGFSVLAHQTLPANDGGISLGQACIAALEH